MAGKLERPETSEPTLTEGDKSFGEALEEMGFLPVPGAKRRTNRRDRLSSSLTHWNKARERSHDGTWFLKEAHTVLEADRVLPSI